MMRDLLRATSVGILALALGSSAQAGTYASCASGAISFYAFDAPVPSLMVQQEYFQGPVMPIDGGPGEPRIAREMATDPALAAAKGDILYGVCSDQVAAFEVMTGVASRVKIATELYLVRNGAGVNIGTLFIDLNRNAQGGGIATQSFFQCSTVTVDGFDFLDWPMIANASMFHTGADLPAISATATQIEQNWTALLRDRVASASEAWIVANTACVPIDKAAFGELVDSGKVPLVEYHVVDPTHDVNGTLP